MDDYSDRSCWLGDYRCGWRGLGWAGFPRLLLPIPYLGFLGPTVSGIYCLAVFAVKVNMQPHDPKNTKKPTKWVGGAGHWAWRGPKASKDKK